eukprot:g1637.t1
MDQIQAALPKMGSSPHESLMDRLFRALQHPMKYQKLTVLVQSGGLKEETTTVVLTGEEWGKLQMLLTILVQHFDEPLLHAILVKTILNRETGKLLEAVHWARTGLELCDGETPEWLAELLKKALALSLSHAAAYSILSKQERVNYRNEATELLMELSRVNKDDSLVLYNLAVLLAESGKYSAATKAVKASMAGGAGSLDPAWALYSLLLSANRDYDGALNSIEGGLTDCGPLYEPLLQIIKSQLLVCSGFSNEAISLLSSACSRYKTEQQMNSDVSLGWKEIQKRQQGMLWKELMELYYSQGRLNDAEYCVGQMEQARPCTPDLFYMKGSLHQEQGNTQQAIQFFEMALSMEPNHEASTLALGKLYLKRGRELVGRGLDGSTDFVLAQSLISNVIQVMDPGNYIGWYNLGLVCKAQGRYEEAKQHLQYATSVSSVSPVKCFKILPRLL